MSHPNANQSRKWHVTSVAETGSTNADLLQQGFGGAADRTVLRADFQSSGRGRLDRTWEAPRGANLLVSFLFRDVPERLHVVTQVVALAAVHTAREQCGIAVDLKWPNDLLVDGEKVAGILAQAAPVGSTGRIPFVVVGIGCNIGWAPEGATSLSAHKGYRSIDPHGFLLAMLPHIDRLFDAADDELHSEYVASLATIGSRVRAQMPGDIDIIGRALDVERDGRLVVLDECGVTHRIDTADVVHLRAVAD